ncbi:hypothetical protein [Prochlorococcus sp. MIT 1307]|uniref:hypothetical protein n=1 Tax=Prochlorococcus sp. MIT 1307 TaxID=3096219 RepID=UPI002A75A94F|nr:hypothetical protein [Prochlorococcus sp. MIT 1307]
MSDSDSPWVSGKEASHHLGVSEKTLQLWREIGYLKPGTHWRSALTSHQMPWKPEVLYHLRWCEEEINYWLAQDAPINDMAA